MPTATAAPPNLHEGLRLLRRAQREIAEARADSALATLAELQATAPQVLVEERESTLVLAWCARGDREQARRLAAELRVKYPGSVYERRLGESCAGAEQPARLLEELRRR